MRTTFIATFAALVGLMGCAIDSGAPGPFASSEAPLTCDSGQSYFYVINRVAIPQVDAAGVLPGFDLDGVTSEPGDAAGCGHVDYTSPEGVHGVDNQFAVFANDVRATLDMGTALGDAMEEGEFAFVLEVQNVDDLLDDDCVSVRIGLGHRPDGGAPELDEDGLAIAGQTYDTRVLTEVGGRIVDGRLETDLVDFESEMTVATPAVPFVVEDARLVASITETSLTQGVVGGKVAVATLEDVATAMTPEMDEVAAIIVNAQADLDPVMGRCTSVSLAFELSGVHAIEGANLD